jgi:two-component system, LytTR family, sensor kinase
MNPNSWKFHTAIWSLFYVANISIDYVIAKGNRSWGWDWFKLLVHPSEIAFLLHAVVICYFTIWLSQKIFRKQPVLFFTIVSIPLFLLSMLMEYGIAVLMGTCPNKDCSLANIVSDSAALNGSIVIFGSMIKLFIDALNSEKLKTKILAEKNTMELAFLKSQINPHFLFNTLNNLYGLSLSEPDKTPDAIIKLSEMMRYMLYESNADLVPLQQEINYLKNYIELQKLRYDGTTYIQFDVKGTPNGQEIAPLLLISFVENAFKHGDVFNAEHPLSMSLSFDTKHLVFDVKNKIHHKNKDEVGGIGVQNVERRLALLYPQKHKLLVNDTHKDTFEAHLEIELTPNPQSGLLE